jgi:hypothetical protein
MDIPAGLNAEQQLDYVVGVVTRRGTLIEYATNGVLRALNEDFMPAVGHAKYPMVSRMLDSCRDRFTHDSRLVEIRADALDLLNRVRAAIDERNELVHSLWGASDVFEADGIPKFRTLKEMAPFLGGKGKDLNPPPGRSIDDLSAVDDTFQKLEMSMNYLAYATTVQMMSYDGKGDCAQTLTDRWFAEIIGGRFELNGETMHLHDRAIAQQLTG